MKSKFIFQFFAITVLFSFCQIQTSSLHEVIPQKSGAAGDQLSPEAKKFLDLSNRIKNIQEKLNAIKQDMNKKPELMAHYQVIIKSSRAEIKKYIAAVSLYLEGAHALIHPSREKEINDALTGNLFTHENFLKVTEIYLQTAESRIESFEKEFQNCVSHYKNAQQAQKPMPIAKS